MNPKNMSRLALDWAAAKIAGVPVEEPTKETLQVFGNLKKKEGGLWAPTFNWEQAGPIIHAFNISIIRVCADVPTWGASTDLHECYNGFMGVYHEPIFTLYQDSLSYGHTPLVAAMRALCASFGEHHEIPRIISFEEFLE